jgi:hypothetical protein
MAEYRYAKVSGYLRFAGFSRAESGEAFKLGKGNSRRTVVRVIQSLVVHDDGHY